MQNADFQFLFKRWLTFFPTHDIIFTVYIIPCCRLAVSGGMPTCVYISLAIGGWISVMNIIGKEQCEDILSSFAWDSTGYEESSGIRAREREDSHIFYFRDWFNIVTDRGLREGRCFRIYENSFSRKRDKFDEDGCVSLCARVRSKFE